MSLWSTWMASRCFFSPAALACRTTAGVAANTAATRPNMLLRSILPTPCCLATPEDARVGARRLHAGDATLALPTVACPRHATIPLLIQSDDETARVDPYHPLRVNGPA